MPAFFGPSNANNGSFEDFLARYLQGQRTSRLGRPVDITRLLSRHTHEVLTGAAQFAVEHGHTDVDALHLLRVMVQTEPVAEALRRSGADAAAIARDAEQRLPETGPRRTESTPALTQSAAAATFLQLEADYEAAYLLTLQSALTLIRWPGPSAPRTSIQNTSSWPLC